MSENILYQGAKLHELCRCCLTLTQKELQHVKFSDVLILFTRITGLQVNLEDDLPKVLCKDCSLQIDIIQKFITKCKKSDDKLKELTLVPQKPKIEENVCEIEVEEVHLTSSGERESFNAFGEENSSQNLVNSETEESQNKTEDLDYWNCKKCTVKYNTVNALTKHYLYHHKIKIKRCKNVRCEDFFLTQNELKTHLEEKHKNKDTSKQKIKIKSNKNSQTKARPIQCFTCKTVFKTTIERREHYSKSSDCLPRKYECKFCDKKYISNSYLNLHVNIEHKENKDELANKCDICGLKIKHKYNMKRHKSTHEQHTEKECPICGKKFTLPLNLKNHMNVHNEVGSFPCPCGIAFRTAYRLRYHQANCPKSGKNTKITKSIQKNLAKRFTCKHCGKIYKGRQNLKLHEANHEGKLERKFLCPICGKRYLTLAGLKYHQQSHNGTKPHECSICNKRFSQKVLLRTHMDRHNGIKRHSCTICKKLFGQQAHLFYHMKVHSGEREFKCNICNKDFMFKHNLKVHMRTHTGEVSHKCPVCEKGFYASNNMWKHVATHHKDYVRKKGAPVTQKSIENVS